MPPCRPNRELWCEVERYVSAWICPLPGNQPIYTHSSQILKFRNLKGLPDPLRLQNLRALLRRVTRDRQSLLEGLQPAKRCEPRAIAMTDPTSQAGCHSAISVKSTRIADGTTTALHGHHRPCPDGAGKGIGRATELPNGSIVVSAGDLVLLAHLGRRAHLGHPGPVVTAVRVPDRAAPMKERRTCRYLVERRETCRKCKFWSWKKLIGKLTPR